MTRLLFLTGLTALLLSACFLQQPPFDEEQWRRIVEQTDSKDLYAVHLRDGVFFNPWLEKEHSFTDFLKWRLSPAPPYSEEARNNKPDVVPQLMQRIAALEAEEDFIVWIGHATFLLRLEGQYWLTDPMFSQRALLPKRITPPAVAVEELSDLEGRLHVVLSHNHYDHLDEKSLMSLPPGTVYYVPEGLGAFVASLVDGPVQEMDWWEVIDTDSFRLTSLPAQHWSRRVFQGYNTTLWASYMIEAGPHTVYFGGDSGYFKGYREIGAKFGEIDYALLPITAYEPRWFMHYAHVDSREAIRAFADLGADYFIPTQWGTFHLGDNPPGLPPLDLRQNIEQLQLDARKFLILDIGEIHLLRK